MAVCPSSGAPRGLGGRLLDRCVRPGRLPGVDAGAENRVGYAREAAARPESGRLHRCRCGMPVLPRYATSQAIRLPS
jgi:hypothetical protein